MAGCMIKSGNWPYFNLAKPKTRKMLLSRSLSRSSVNAGRREHTEMQTGTEGKEECSCFCTMWIWSVLSWPWNFTLRQVCYGSLCKYLLFYLYFVFYLAYANIFSVEGLLTTFLMLAIALLFSAVSFPSLCHGIKHTCRHHQCRWLQRTAIHSRFSVFRSTKCILPFRLAVRAWRKRPFCFSCPV